MHILDDFLHLSPPCELDIEDSEPSFVHDTQPHDTDNTPPYQVQLKMVERCRRYHPDKLGHTNRTDGQMDGWTNRRSDSNISSPPPPRVGQ